MRILLLVVVLTGTAHGADIHDERSNRIGRTEERQGRIEVYDVQSSRIGEGVRQSDGSVEFRDQRRTRLPLIAQLPSGRIAQRPNRPIAASLPVSPKPIPHHWTIDPSSRTRHRSVGNLMRLVARPGQPFSRFSLCRNEAMRVIGFIEQPASVAMILPLLGL